MTLDFEKYGRILHDFASQLSQDASFPIHLGTICRKFGVVSISRTILENGPALLIDADTQPKILLKKPEAGSRAAKKPFTPWERFLIAHELAHLILRRAKMPLPAGAKQYWKTEFLCDAFARELLIPEKIAHQMVGHSGINGIEWLRLTARLARQSHAPWITAGFRLSDINQRAIFFKVVQTANGGLRVLSTSPHNKGVSTRIRPDTALCERLLALRSNQSSVELAPEAISGLLKQGIVERAAGYATEQEIRLAAFTT